MSLKICANACNRTRSDCNCSLIDKYFDCEHEQCIKTTCDIFYCIHCGCNNLNEEKWAENAIKYFTLGSIKAGKKRKIMR
jgi:hypothetical protein